jgi:hypothetical protein
MTIVDLDILMPREEASKRSIRDHVHTSKRITININ